MNYLKTEFNFSKNTYCTCLQLKILPTLILFFIAILSSVSYGNDLIENTKLGLKPKSSGITNKIAEEVANKRVISSKELKPFNVSDELKKGDGKYVQDEVYLSIDKEEVKKIYENKKEFVVLNIPVSDTKSFQVELVKTNIFSDSFRARSSSGQSLSQKDIEAIFYRGIVKNDQNSIVSLTVFKDNLEGIIADDFGNYVLGKVKQSIDEYILYNDKKLKVSSNYTCGVSDEIGKDIEKQIDNNNKSMGGGSIGVYIEADYQMYKDHDDNRSNVQNYIYNLFNQVKTIYALESVDIHISETFVWEQPDPYMSATNTFNLRAKFQAEKDATLFTGNLAHLISTRSVGGGRAFIDELCGNKPYAVSGNMNTNVVPFPTYSWDVYVFAHEMGHNVGSRHTHACVWGNNNDTAIDGCAGFTEGSCAVPSIPSNGGTIMSYCHLKSVSINFNLGFGSQPGDLIRDKYENATCTNGMDIFITEEFVSNTNPSEGDVVTISCYQNVANATVNQLSPYPDVKFYVSDDLIVDGSDKYLGYELSTIGISDPNDFEDRNVTVASSWGTGTKYILFVADANQEHSEIYENNNLEYVQINISGGPDLIVENESLNKTTACAYEYIKSNSRVRNIGSATATLNTRLKYYLSTNNTYGSSDVFLNRDYVDQLAPGAFNDENAWLRTPANTSPGSYYILFVADETDICAESNENNNVGSVPITIVSCRLANPDNVDGSENKQLNSLNFTASPNHFDELTQLSYTLEEKGLVTITLYDMAGKKVEQLLNEKMQEAGHQTIQLKATDNMSNGLYLCHINTGKMQQSIKIIINK